jgi:hypothetical protein
MSHGGSEGHFRDFQKSFHQFRHEFRGLVAVKNFRGPVSEDNLVQELRDDGLNLSVGESYNRYETGGGIDDGQSFGFAG